MNTMSDVSELAAPPLMLRASNAVETLGALGTTEDREDGGRAAGPRNALPRLIFINRYFYPDESATSQILYDLTSRLARDGFEVHVVTSRQLYCDPNARLPSREIVSGVHVHRIWTCRFGRTKLFGRACDYVSFYPLALLALLRLVRRDDVLIAKTDPPLISVLAAAVASLRGARLINWLQDVFPEVATQLFSDPLPPWANKLIGYLRDRSLSAAKCNVVLGTRMRDHLLKRGVDPRSLRVIENWADGGSIEPLAKSTNRLREKHGLQNKFVVAYSGNLGRAHEFGTIVDAAELLRDNEDVVFLMIGGGVKMQALRLEVARRGLANFRFLPYQPRETLSDSLSAADVHLACLLPSLEGLIVPSKFYGILAAGRPVVFIGDPEGELARVVKSTGCGATVEIGAAQELARVITHLKEDAEALQEQGDRARGAFEAFYTLDAAAEKWLDVFKEAGVSPPVNSATAIRSAQLVVS